MLRLNWWGQRFCVVVSSADQCITISPGQRLPATRGASLVHCIREESGDIAQVTLAAIPTSGAVGEVGLRVELHQISAALWLGLLVEQGHGVVHAVGGVAQGGGAAIGASLEEVSGNLLPVDDTGHQSISGHGDANELDLVVRSAEGEGVILTDHLSQRSGAIEDRGAVALLPLNISGDRGA